LHSQFSSAVEFNGLEKMGQRSSFCTQGNLTTEKGKHSGATFGHYKSGLKAEVLKNGSEQNLYCKSEP